MSRNLKVFVLTNTIPPYYLGVFEHLHRFFANLRVLVTHRWSPTGIGLRPGVMYRSRFKNAGRIMHTRDMSKVSPSGYSVMSRLTLSHFCSVIVPAL